MNKFSLVILATLTTALSTAKELDSGYDQIELFRQRTPDSIGILTTSAGKPVSSNETHTLNKNLLNNAHFIDSITHLNREKIPERVVHAKGAGAFGYFEVTDNITWLTKAKFLNKIGKKTPVAVRFSLLESDEGVSDTTREPRGFAIKFYTKEGNLDLVGLNIPMFAIKDPVHFADLVHASKRNPATHLIDINMSWDIVTLLPESLFFVLYVKSDRGIPAGYRHMPGFPVHTYQLVNEKGVSHFVRFHFIPDAGIKNICSEKACQIGTDNSDYSTVDLYNAIAKGNHPSWTCYVQVLTMNDVKNADFDVFDVTRILPLSKYPLKRFGKMVLKTNPKNYFAEVEQLAFSVGNLVPGILGAPDKVFEARAFAYKDAQYYRLGGNFMKIPVNCPLHSKALTNLRDGDAPVNDNGGDAPNYTPDSFNGPTTYKDKNAVDLIQIYQGEPYNFDQAKDFYRSLTAGGRRRLVENIVFSLKLALNFLQDRAVKLFRLIDPDLGNRVREGLKANGTHSDNNTFLVWRSIICKMN